MIKIKRSAGILLPISSLPSDYGIGCFSKESYLFVDWLCNAGQSFWQILPTGPTGFGDSPYQAFSSYAGNPYFISLDALISDGLLTHEECRAVDFGDNPRYVDYGKLFSNRYSLLNKAFKRFNPSMELEYNNFIKKNAFWLEDYALFFALKIHFDNRAWYEWKEDIRLRHPEAVSFYKELLSESIDFCKFLQFEFFTQWSRLKSYANEKGIEIIGDLPIYAALDSADVWANPGLFDLDSDGQPNFSAGCPPDGFSPEGQLWGNPLYNWEIHKRTGYNWWCERFTHSFSLYDYVRIDHFRGFDEYYKIPFGAANAINGHWAKGPGYELFNAVKKKNGLYKFIAEDLGFMTESVKELLRLCGFPGMRVLQFAFDLRDNQSKNDHLPHNYPKNCVAYTGTHDNQSLKAWFSSLSSEEQQTAVAYLCDFYTPEDKLNFPFISLLMRSSADLCIIPLQDYLRLGDEARINTPSTSRGNWQWRLCKNELDSSLAQRIFRMTEQYSRI